MQKPYKIYSNAIEGKALSQFFDAMKLDCVVQGALMPDAHAGYTLPIGAVVACDGMVFPSYVGYDIGCGVCAIPTAFDAREIRANAKAIFDQIYRDIPTGFAHNAKAEDWSPVDDSVSDFVQKEIIGTGAPEKQLGTLGGGNHFVEIGEDEAGTAWIVIHSGSRNIGHKIATHYMKLASGTGKASEGHFGLRTDSDAGREYIADLAFGLDFALANRRTMLMRAEKTIARYVSGGAYWEHIVNRNHNHCELKDDLWIHRKGATHAEDGMMGVIPGSMRDGSFIVRGKGNPESLCSSSHGAGRVMGRKEAKERLDMDVFRAEMAERGIQARVDAGTLDESAGAYKDIFEVMAMQRDLVEVIHHIKPLINIKG